jgi:hypothetical protein
MMAVATPLPFIITPLFEQPSNSPAFSLRRATIDDLDSIVDIALATMPLDPQWNWRFPYRGEYPEDERLFTRNKFEEFLITKNRWVVMVVETPNKDGVVIPIALAIWDLVNVDAMASKLGRKHTALPPVSPGVRRDGHPERMEAWTKTTLSKKQELFDRRYGRRYIQLQILATLPQWQRMGAATLLCSCGMRMANLLRLSVAVFASPMGSKLYASLGFRTLETINVRASNDDDGVNLTGMALEQ